MSVVEVGQIVQIAELPREPSGPSHAVPLTSGFGVGILLGVALAAARESGAALSPAGLGGTRRRRTSSTSRTRATT